MAADKQRRTHSDVGPTGHQIAANLRRLRDARRLSTAEVARQMQERGVPVQPTGITRIEHGERRISAEELTALSLVLGVNPTALLLPPTIDGESEVTGAGAVRNEALWDWADGRQPLRPVDDDGSAYVDFQTHARPEGRRRFAPPPRQVDLLRQEGAEITDHGDGTYTAVRKNGTTATGRF